MDSSVFRFLDLIAWSEATSRSLITRANGYDIIVSGPDGPESFNDFSTHPFDHDPPRPPKLIRPQLYSTASGRYQVLRWVWRSYRQLLNLPDFSPASQDAIAVQQLKETSALSRIQSGDISGAIQCACRIWASLPGNDYKQGGHSMAALLDQWEKLASSETA